MKRRLKPILPTLREKKRYVAFKIVSSSKVADVSVVTTAIMDNALGLLGELGVAEAGIMMLTDKYNTTKQTGIIRVSHKHVDKLKTALMMIRQIDGTDALVHSVGVSGILKKVAG